MSSLFSTSSEKAGFRLQYMEILNWGTFNEKIFKISPQGNNSLLTGANASGKSTFIDALLTLIVPSKKDREYNQAVGGDTKGGRTEESYVLGHYGKLHEGEAGTKTLMLRGQSDYSILLASFSNTDQSVVTVFQVRWFSNGELKRAFGIAHIGLEIARDFADFDPKHWKKSLEQAYNAKSPKKKVEFPDGPTAYGKRIADLLGMRSDKALSLFNQITGLKTLDDLDGFIRFGMLEAEDAEGKFGVLSKTFTELIGAKTSIEKAKEQIAQLSEIDKTASKITEINGGLNDLKAAKEASVYWFAKKSIALAEKELEKESKSWGTLEEGLKSLRSKESELKDRESDLAVQIKTDAVGNQIKLLEAEIGRLEKSKESRVSKLKKYNSTAKDVGFSPDPDKESFETNRGKADSAKEACQTQISAEGEKLRLAKNAQDALTEKINERVATIETLQKTKNNISGKEAEIREAILKHLGAAPEEMPFIGELIKVREGQAEWERSIEKVLHGFAMRLIVPEKYYRQTNAYVNQTNLKGRIVYQRYKSFASLAAMSPKNTNPNALLHKIEFKPQSVYAEWLEDAIANRYNFACAENTAEFDRYDEYAITKEGLIKYAKGKHEKDDTPRHAGRENYVLGWDNKEKIKALRAEVKELHEEQKNALKTVREINQRIEKTEKLKEAWGDLFKLYTKYDEIDWQFYANEILEKTEAKERLEKTNDRVKELGIQLKAVQDELKKLSEETIADKSEEIFNIKAIIKNITEVLESNRALLNGLAEQDTSVFESAHPDLQFVGFAGIKAAQNSFNEANLSKKETLEEDKQKNEKKATAKIAAFKNPDEELAKKFKDWRSDVNSLPDPDKLHLIGEYQTYLAKLKEDSLPEFEKEFNKLLVNNLSDKIGEFKRFFTDWADSIKENIGSLNDALKGIDFSDEGGIKTYIQLIASPKKSKEVAAFEDLLHNAISNVKTAEASLESRKTHFEQNIQPLMDYLAEQKKREEVMEVRAWFVYKAEEFDKETRIKTKTHAGTGTGSGGEQAKLTYTVLGSAIAYQFGLTAEGLQSKSFRFITIDESFKGLDEVNADYLLRLCKQLHLQLLVVTPLDGIQIVEKHISSVHLAERKPAKNSWLYDMPIEQFQAEKEKYLKENPIEG